MSGTAEGMLSEVMLQFAVAICISNSAIIYIAQDVAIEATPKHGTVIIERESALELRCRNIVYSRSVLGIGEALSATRPTVTANAR